MADARWGIRTPIARLDRPSVAEFLLLGEDKLGILQVMVVFLRLLLLEAGIIALGIAFIISRPGVDLSLGFGLTQRVFLFGGLGGLGTGIIIGLDPVRNRFMKLAQRWIAGRRSFRRLDKLAENLWVQNKLQRWVRDLIVWTVVLICGVLFLYGRFAWDVRKAESLRSYLSSAYMFTLTLPALYYTLVHFIRQRRVVLGVTAIVGVWLTLPHRWLGLDRFYSLLMTLQGQGWSDGEVHSLNWLPGALSQRPTIPYEMSLLVGLVLVGLLVADSIWWRRILSHVQVSRRCILLWLGVYLLILVQTWLHLSLRSPYSYTPYFEQPPEKNRWYVVFLFPGFKGAVNADYWHFAGLEQVFQGVVFWSNLLLRRSFYHYFTSQFSFFVNPYYVGLIFNIFIWFSAVVCGYLFTKRLWNERIAFLTAGMIACGPGFIHHVAQPMLYTAGYAAYIILIYLFQRVVIEEESAVNRFILFGVLLGFGLMTYDLFPLLLFILGYGLLQRIPIGRLLSSIGLSLVIYFGWMYVQTNILKQTIPQDNQGYLTTSMAVIWDMIRHPNLGQWYALSTGFFSRYFTSLNNAVFCLPLIAAGLGLVCLRGRLQILTALLLFVPSASAQAALYFGGAYFYGMPKYFYIAYPGVYILAALFLDTVANAPVGRKWAWMVRALPWGFLSLLFFINNVDVFGFPVFHFLFYKSSGGEWLFQ